MSAVSARISPNIKRLTNLARMHDFTAGLVFTKLLMPSLQKIPADNKTHLAAAVGTSRDFHPSHACGDCGRPGV